MKQLMLVGNNSCGATRGKQMPNKHTGGFVLDAVPSFVCHFGSIL
jgi:hypothetical protein